MAGVTATPPDTMRLGRGTPAERVFRRTTARTLAQDVWIIRHVTAAGIASLALPSAIGQDPAALAQFTLAVVDRVYQANLVPEVVAGFIVPEGEVWDRDRAPEITAFLANLADEGEKQWCLSILAQVLMSFLSAGRKS